MSTSSYPNVQLLINNTWRDARAGETIAVHDPSTGERIGSVAHARKADLDDALEATVKGFEVWRKTPAVERTRLMREAARLLRERADGIARLMTLEQGKPLAEAKGETLFACDTIDTLAEEGRRVYGRIVQPRAAATLQQVFKEPVGPVAAFTPWNFPINQIVRKLSAALSTGCSIIIKAPKKRLPRRPS